MPVVVYEGASKSLLPEIRRTRKWKPSQGIGSVLDNLGLVAKIRAFIIFFTISTFSFEIEDLICIINIFMSEINIFIINNFINIHIFM